VNLPLSFDEVVVTIFTAPAGVDTLPLWILKEMPLPNQASVVNVVAAVVILISLIPIYISQRLSRAQDEPKELTKDYLSASNTTATTFAPASSIPLARSPIQPARPCFGIIFAVAVAPDLAAIAA